MSPSNGIDSIFLEVGTAEKLKIYRSLNGAFWLNLKRCKMRPDLSLSNVRGPPPPPPPVEPPLHV